MMTKLSKAGKMLDFRVVAAIICQACEGLHAAHEARGPDGQLLGVVHRDVSPPNIMVISDGAVKLLDFGIAKARGINSRTRTGTVKGKNAYMSPEQIFGKPLDRRSDIFALGVVMYELVGIRRLFHRDSDFLTFKAITEEAIPDIRERRPDIPPGLRAALIQAMARDPNGRFETAKQFGNAIRNGVATLGGPSPQQDLARLLFTDFSDEMAARDEILKAAEDPGHSAPPAPRAMPPPIPVRATKPPIAAAGEMSQATPPSQERRISQAIPTIMVSQGSQRVRQPDVIDLDDVLDLSSNIAPDTWMADPGTNLLSAHRWKSLRNLGIAALALVAGALTIFFVTRGDDAQPQRIVVATAGNGKVASDPAGIACGAKCNAAFDPSATVVLVATPAPGWTFAGWSGACSAANGACQLRMEQARAVTATFIPEARPEDEPDAGSEMSHDDIYALSKYGFFSITATAKTTIYLDGKLIGETPLTRLPVLPGPHVVKAVGPRGKPPKILNIRILGGKDDDEGTITW